MNVLDLSRRTSSVVLPSLAYQFSIITVQELEKHDKLSKIIHSCITIKNFLEQVLTNFIDKPHRAPARNRLKAVSFLLQSWIKFQYELIHNQIKMKINCTLVLCFNCSAWSNTAIHTSLCEVF